jgi:gamma-glutamylcyclotransferase (GGCT)/AIG2-like uncharacterized protein YtfP
VYGSLLRGLGNHRLLEGGRFIAADVTRRAFTLFDLGSFPGMCAAGETSVVGEVWEVDASTLARLDRLEGHPRFYQRTPIVLRSRRHAETYVLPMSLVQGRVTVVSGDWRTYRKAAGTG